MKDTSTASQSVPDNSKHALLASLVSNGNYQYKRFSGLPLRYAGGKSLAVGHIVEQLPDNLERLVSPFFGGGSVEIACANRLGIPVQGYDVFDILVNYWRIQLKHPQQLATQIRQWQPNKEVYAEVKKQLRDHWDGTKPTKDKLKLAASYWFNHNLSYGPGFLGWMSKIYEDQARAHRLINKVESFRCPNLAVQHGSFERIISQHQGDFLYCDPPYYLDGNSKMFRGIYPQRNFPVHHTGFAHKRLCELLHQHHGGFVLSYNDCETIRNWYADCRIVEATWQYTLGQGETRIGKNRMVNGSGHVKKSHELIIVKA